MTEQADDFADAVAIGMVRSKRMGTSVRGQGFAGGMLLAIHLAGCGASDGMTPVSGSVQFDGQPIVYGEVFFKPDESKGHSGPQGFALIKDGSFNTKVTGQGVVPGPHIVQLTGYAKTPVASDDDNNPPPEIPPIFSGYTMPVLLNGSHLSLTVPAEARQQVATQKKKPKR